MRFCLPTLALGLAMPFATPLACEPPATPPAPVAVVIPTATASTPLASSSTPPPSAPCPPPRVWPTVTLPADADASITPGPSPNATAIANASPTLRAACRSIETANKQHRAAIYRSGPGPFGKEAKDAIWKSAGLGCWRGAKGAWTLDVGIFRPKKDEGEIAPWSLVYLTPEAKRVTDKDARGEIDMWLGEGQTTFQMFAAFDFDGDGVDEVEVSQYSIWSIDSVPHEALHGYRLREGKIVAWDPVPGRIVLDWADVDRDGRPDLVLAGLPGAVAIAHSLPGGRFSLDDDVTRAVLHASCARPAPVSSPFGSSPLALGDEQAARAQAAERRASVCEPVMDRPCP